jgi:2-oxoisovalerate dehydrogenase E1 component alpha subunit
VSISSPVGTQIPQAVGVGVAARLRGKDSVAVAYFGEGTSSTGQFHVGLNFAGVYKAPVIFVCRNNGWAISTSREKQTASKTFAQKAVAYGIAGVRVDGNDILAMIAAMNEAVARARSGGGPTLIEAQTYRRGGHSSSDDPSVYRDPAEPKKWEKRDPLMRLTRYLERKKLWTQEWEDGLRDKMNEDITEALKYAEAVAPKPPLETMFEDVYANMPRFLEEQMSGLRDHLALHPIKTGH